MKTNSLFWAMSWVAAGSLAIVQGCGGDDDDSGGNTGGSSGSGGSSGKGGSSGSSGSAGKGGSSGSSGASGTGGKGGTAGQGGTTTGGTSGAGGAPGGAGGEGGGSAPDETRVMVCGLYCASYYAAMCDDFDTDSYDNEADCNSTCVGSDWELGNPGGAGDTISCRRDHAGLAQAATTPADRELHCGHASAESTGVCVAM
jgi:hypothetical protein